MLSGVFATLNNAAVALFTLASVAWADRITEIRSSKVLEYTSSVEGEGFRSLRHEKIAVLFLLFNLLCLRVWWLNVLDYHPMGKTVS